MHKSRPNPVIQHNSLSIQGKKMPGHILESIDRLARIAANVYLKKAHLIL